MDFKSMLQTISQLSEAETRKVKGTRYGGEAQHDDEDDEDDDTKKAAKKQEPAAKRGRGRPKKGADSETGQVAKYDNAKNLQSFMVGNVPKKSKDLDKLPKKKHTLKDWVEHIEAKYVAEAAPGQALTVKPMPSAAQLVDPATQKVMATGDAAAVKNIQGAVAQGKVQMRGEEMAESDEDYSAKKARAGKDIGKPGKQFSKIAQGAAKRYGSAESGKKVAGAVLAKLRSKTNEADIPSDQTDMGAGLGAGRSGNVLEGKKPDFLDLDKDKNKKESMEKAAQDAKKKKKVKEGMEHHLHAARLEGKSHALRKMPYNCTHDDMEESRMYHEGFKEGLDECYGQGVYETAPAIPPATVSGMAGQVDNLDEMDMYEMDKTEWMQSKARSTPGDTFNAFGQTMHDKDVLDDSMFESWDNELNSLLNESEEVSEGMTVSISKGQQGSPDSVSVSAQDGEADQLLSLIKSAGLGLFGGDDSSHSSSMSLQPSDGAPDDIGVVDDHDGMMALIKKVTGGTGEPNTIAIGGDDHGDYEDEEGHGDEHDHEETCESCGGIMEAGHSCDSKEMVDEVESYDQEIEIAAEDNAPDSGAEDSTADENAEAEEDEALAIADLSEEQVEESLANGADDTFEADVNFMTKVISAGLNGEKSTGQTTIPVIAGQGQRMVAHESVSDWKKLAGIK